MSKSYYTWQEIQADIIDKKKFEFIDHSIKQPEELKDKQRCGHCGVIFPLNQRGIGGMSNIDDIIPLCRDCNLPYRRQTWTERKINSARKQLDKETKIKEDFIYDECAVCSDFPCYRPHTWRMNGKCLDLNPKGGKK